MDMESAKHMEARASQSRSRQCQLIAACALYIGSSVAVRAEMVPAADGGFRFVSGAEIPVSAELHSHPMPLRVSSALDSLRRVDGVPTAAPLAARPTRSFSAPRLRLAPALASRATAANSGSKLVLPAGELSRAGIVRATAVKIRDGAFYLVGSYSDHDGTVQIAGDDALPY
jgi:hypothetical protein